MSLKLNSLLIMCFTFIVSFFGFSQPGGDWTDKLSWEFSLEKKDASHAYLVANAKIKKGWHIYSVNHDPDKADFTGFPTTFKFLPSKNYRTIGKLMDTKKALIHKDDLGVSLIFENAATFKQEIEFLSSAASDIKFGYTFQICDENGCIFPPEQEGSIKAVGYLPVANPTAVLPSVDSVPLNSNVEEENVTDIKNDNHQKDRIKLNPIKVNSSTKDSWWVIFLKGFGGGLIALLTPCVFPMIPMTVTFFTKRSKSRTSGILNALLYGVSIIVIYVILGVVITALLGPSGLNDLSTNVWMNLVFFAIFVFFAFSFLGAFEIRLPNSWVNKADGNADKGGLIGIFFMAFTLSLVSFSCTGPIIGTLLVESATGGSLIAPTIGMAGFSMALALPFTLFAIFPGWLNSLPQSGGWLNSVKVVLGLLELALALKFLSGIDLAYHWGILTREVFVAVWIVVFFIIGFYLLGKLRFSHDSEVEKLSVTRFMFALFAFVFAVYLIPGMWGAPLRLIDGVAPPRTHSEDQFKFVKGEGASGVQNSSPNFLKFRADMEEVGDGELLVFHDLEKAKEYARLENKPILLDFTGYNCPNCRRTESTVWSHPEIAPLLKEKMVIASLYVDDREELPKKDWKYSKAIQGTIKTVGNKWSDYQVTHYGQLSQPLYVMINEKGEDLTEPIGYEPSITNYKNFLMKGLNKF